jgi:hypothetical protein
MSDLLARPISAFFWWCLPLIIGFAGQMIGQPVQIEALVWALSLAWMGTGCVLNAMRCHRLHCYIAGPVFLVGALAEASIGAHLLVLGIHAVNNIAGATLLLTLLSFVPEFYLGRYRRR